MPEFKNKEEYEKWKAERISKTKEETSSIKEYLDEKVEKPKSSRKLLLFSFLILIMLIPVGIYVYSRLSGKSNFETKTDKTPKTLTTGNDNKAAIVQEHKKENEGVHRNELFFDDASKALAELERLSAILEVGISYDDYIRKLGEINYPVSSFLRKYVGNKSLDETSSVIYQVIKNSLDLYLTLADRWKVAKHTGNVQVVSELRKIILEGIISDTNSHLKEGWSIIANHLHLARKLIEAKNEETNKRVTEDLVRAQELWNTEDKAYMEKIRSHRKALDIF